MGTLFCITEKCRQKRKNSLKFTSKIIVRIGYLFIYLFMRLRTAI